MTTIQAKIDQRLLEKDQARKERPRSGKFHPSSLARCFRYQLWNKQGKEQSDPIDARTRRVFAVGDLFHEFVRGFLPEHDSEVLVKDDNFVGYADIVTEDTVYDVKSQHSQGFWYMTKPGYSIEEEKLPNILQVALYAKLLKKPKMGLVFISKDDLCINEYMFDYSKWEPTLSEEIAELIKWHSSDKLPPAQPRAYGGKECKYCPYKTACKERERENGESRISNNGI